MENDNSPRSPFPAIILSFGLLALLTNYVIFKDQRGLESIVTDSNAIGLVGLIVFLTGYSLLRKYKIIAIILSIVVSLIFAWGFGVFINDNTLQMPSVYLVINSYFAAWGIVPALIVLLIGRKSETLMPKLVTAFGVGAIFVALSPYLTLMFIGSLDGIG